MSVASEGRWEQVAEWMIRLSIVPFILFLCLSPLPILTRAGHFLFLLGKFAAVFIGIKCVHEGLAATDWMHGAEEWTASITTWMVYAGVASELRRHGDEALPPWYPTYGLASFLILCTIAALLVSLSTSGRVQFQKEMARARGDPRDSLSIHTWASHIINMTLWLAAMQATCRLGEVRGQPALVASAWAMHPSHVINVGANVLHLCDDHKIVQWLIKVLLPIFALLTYSFLVAVPIFAKTASIPLGNLPPHDGLGPELKTFAFMVLEALVLGTVAKYGRLLFNACVEPPAWVPWMLLGVGSVLCLTTLLL